MVRIFYFKLDTLTTRPSRQFFAKKLKMYLFYKEAISKVHSLCWALFACLSSCKENKGFAIIHCWPSKGGSSVLVL